MVLFFRLFNGPRNFLPVLLKRCWRSFNTNDEKKNRWIFIHHSDSVVVTFHFIEVEILLRQIIHAHQTCTQTIAKLSYDFLNWIKQNIDSNVLCIQNIFLFYSLLFCSCFHSFILLLCFVWRNKRKRFTVNSAYRANNLFGSVWNVLRSISFKIFIFFCQSFRIRSRIKYTWISVERSKEKQKKKIYMYINA